MCKATLHHTKKIKIKYPKCIKNVKMNRKIFLKLRKITLKSSYTSLKKPKA